jgi:glycerol-3-phosphate dehydrogenase (NAD(P)+)
MSKKIAVIGAGSWGTALSVVLAKKELKVNLWAHRKQHAEQMQRDRQNNEYLPGVVFPDSVNITHDLNEALKGVLYVVLVIPSHTMRETLCNIKEFIDPNMVFISATKGIENGTLKRMSEVMKDELPQSVHKNIAVLSGPSHAEEVGRDIPTTVVAASQSKDTAKRVQNLFMTPRFRVYTNSDVIGVELGGALKNVIALGAGISEGLGFGDNTKAALMTRGMVEMTRLGIAMGANPLTFAGLSGIGDLIVTCTSMHSRNRRAGILIGKGQKVSEVLKSMNMVVEGVRTTSSAYDLKQKYNISMPITTEMYNILFNDKDPREAAELDLMMRGKTHEIEEVALATNNFDIKLL